MVKRKPIIGLFFEYSFKLLKRISPFLLGLIIIYSVYIKDVNRLILISLILLLGKLYQKYGSYHHALPIIAFYSINIVQEWFEILLELI
jgi:hypothetical protein